MKDSILKVSWFFFLVQVGRYGACVKSFLSNLILQNISLLLGFVI